MEIDLGGDLTSANRQLVQRAVMMGVMAEVGVQDSHHPSRIRRIMTSRFPRFRKVVASSRARATGSARGRRAKEKPRRGDSGALESLGRAWGRRGCAPAKYPSQSDSNSIVPARQ